MRVLWVAILFWGFLAPLSAQTFSSNLNRYVSASWGGECGMWNWPVTPVTASTISSDAIVLNEGGKTTDGEGVCNASAFQAQFVLSFDTSAIGSATVSTAQLSLFVIGSAASGGYAANLSIYSASQNDTILACSTGATVIGSRAVSGLVSWSRNGITLTPSSINRTGTTILRVMVTPCPPTPADPFPSSFSNVFGRANIRVSNPDEPQLIITLASGVRLIIVSEGT